MYDIAIVMHHCSIEVDMKIISVSFRKIYKGGKMILRENLGGQRDCVR